MRRLGIYAAGNALLWAGYHWINPFPDYVVNRIVTVEICAVSIMCVAIPIVWTRHWRVLSVGLLGLFAGLALLYYPFATDGTLFAMRDNPRPAPTRIRSGTRSSRARCWPRAAPTSRSG